MWKKITIHPPTPEDSGKENDFTTKAEDSKVTASCLSLDCPERTGGVCKYASQEQQEDFDKRWDEYIKTDISFDDIKQFILSEKAKEREETAKEILGMIRKDDEDGCSEEYIRSKTPYKAEQLRVENEHVKARNAFRKRLREKIKSEYGI